MAFKKPLCECLWFAARLTCILCDFCSCMRTTAFGIALLPASAVDRHLINEKEAAMRAVVVVLIAALSVVGCSQSVSPTVPSAATPVASSSLGPGASYDASGTWRFVTTNADGNVEETFDTTVTQDANGTLSFVNGDSESVTFERLGTGVIVTYSLSITSVESGCDAVHVRGLARLDTRTNTITMPIRLRGCSQTVGYVVTGTKLS